MPKIVVRKGQNANAEYVLDGEKFTLGRRKACEIPIGDAKASRNHAQIFKQGNRFYIRDLASRNGTFLNSERLAGDTELSFGDQIAIGEMVLEFVEEFAGKPIDFEIPGYQIVERIGEGGMGVVYKARQVSMDRVVALKVLSEKYSANGEFIDRFIREARAAGKLNHPNVIHVHDVSKAGGRYFFSMEFVDGPTVKKLLKDQGRLPVGKCLEIIIQAAKALEFAHENGIIHRDVKPDNIMLTSEGIVKIADLGIAKSFEEVDPVQTAGKRRVLGTPHYMAPEQAMGKALDRRADVYSLGATLYHMLTGKTPFKGSTITELLKAHVHEKLEPVQLLNPEVPDAVCFVVERMMAKLPERRYENMTRLLEDLERVSRDAAGAQIEQLAPEDSTIMHAVEAKAAAEARARAKVAARPVRRNAALGAVTTAVAVLLVLAVLAGTYLLFRKKREGPEPEGRPPGPTTQVPTPAGSPAAQLLQQARDAQRDGKEDVAQARASEVIARFPGTPEEAEAKKLIEAIKDRQARARQAEIRALVEAAEKVARDKPEDLGAQLVAWDKIVKDYPDAPEAKVAETRIADIRKLKAAAEEKVRGEKAAAADQKAQAALAAKDFIAAAEAVRSLAAEFPESDEGKRAAERVKEIEAQADKLLADAEKAAGDAVAAGRFETAVGVFKDLETAVKTAKWMAELPKKVEAVKAKIKEESDKALKPIWEAAKAGKLAEALHDAKNALTRFKGTAHEAEIKEVVEGLEAQPALLKKVVAGINQQGLRDLKFTMEATLPPGKWQVAKATEERVELVCEHTLGNISSPLPWAKLSAKDAYGLYLMYLDKPAAADHRALAFFCTLRGLTAEAENHKKLAAGN